MPAKTENKEITEWEEHAAAVVAGVPYSARDHQEQRNAVYGRTRIWNVAVLISGLVVLFSAVLPAWQFGMFGMGIPEDMVFLNAEFHRVEPGNPDSWKNYFSGYWGIAKWVALSVLIAHVWVGSLVRSTHRRVVRIWNFMGSHSEEGRRSNWSVPRIPRSYKEVMLATTFRGFWLKTTGGIRLSPFGLRMVLLLVFILLYPGLVYLGVFSSTPV